ncbi:MAG: acyltransferase [Burkholderiales bacterium]|nr:acyltransferase [Burkholderiales bacterium]
MKRRVKNWIKALIYRPMRVAMGRGSRILWPRTLCNRGGILLGTDCHVGAHVVLNSLRDESRGGALGRIVLGNDVYVGGYTQIHAMNRIELGEGSVLSEHVYISDVAHGLDPKAGPIMKQPNVSRGPVVLGKGVFIGYGCSVLPGVTLGDHCVVGTRSVVTRSFPPYSMVVGAPARLIKSYDMESGKWLPAE